VTLRCRSIDVIETDDIPESVLELAKEKRTELLEQLAEVDDEIGEMLMRNPIANCSLLPFAELLLASNSLLF
jgi:elongation factor G